jgi:MATE family multidrug resistance protein
MKCGRKANSLFELRAILRISGPLAAAYLAEIAMGITDMLFVGRLGSVELAAVGLASSVLFEILIVAVGVVSIVAVLAAEARGAGSSEGVRRAVRQGFLVALVLGVPGMIIGWNLAPLLAMTGQDPRVIAFADQYLHAAAWAIIPYLLFVVLRSFVAALSRAGSVMVVTVTAIGINALLTYALVFGNLGMPALGVAGAGWATTITIWLMLGALVFHTGASRKFRPFRLYAAGLRLDPSVFREILRLGAPVAGITLLEGGLFAAVSIVMGVLGASWLAANQIMLNVLAVGFVIALAIGEAAGVRISHGAGAGKPHDVRRSAAIGVGLGSVVMILFASLLWLFPQQIVSVFLNIGDAGNSEVVAYAVILAGIAAVFQVFDGLQAIASRALRGMKDTLVPMWIASVGYWVLGAAGGWALCFPLGYGARGLWWGLALGLIVTAVALVWRLMALTRADYSRAGGKCAG